MGGDLEYRYEGRSVFDLSLPASADTYPSIEDPHFV